jgi:hypothetical protein
MGTSGFGEDVHIEHVSDELLRVSINGVATEVFVQRTYRIHDHFGEFTSLEHLVSVLRALQREPVE